LGKDVVATEELRDGVCRVELHLDPAREATPFARLPELAVLSARPGEMAVSKKMQMNWSSADTLLAEIPVAGSETILTTVSAPGVGQATLAPMCLPYSPEYLPQRAGKGVAALEQLAKSTGGCQRLNLGDIWRDVPRRPRLISLTPYLLLAAVVVFLLEVVQRRTGLLSIRWKLPTLRWRWKFASARPASISPVETTEKVPAAPAAKKSLPAATKKPPAKTETGNEGMLDALSQAQRRARTRTERD
jgi:hypothetical protein